MQIDPCRVPIVVDHRSEGERMGKVHEGVTDISRCRHVPRAPQAEKLSLRRVDTRGEETLSGSRVRLVFSGGRTHANLSRRPGEASPGGHWWTAWGNIELGKVAT